MEKEKVKGVLGWLVPKMVRDIRKFLGLANYYKQFVKDFTKLARPLNNLMRKTEKWNWEQTNRQRLNSLSRSL